MDVRTGLYRIYDDADALLYVGISVRPRLRVEQHRRKAHWGADIARYDVEWVESRPAAFALEAATIATERPLYNKAKSQARHPQVESALPFRLPVVASAEIAYLLGVSRQRVNQIVNMKGFPDPVAELIAATIWMEADVRAWAKRTGRKVAA